MTETFTFKTPHLMPLRLRLVNAESNRRMKWLSRHAGSDEAQLFRDELRLRTGRLHEKVEILWDHFRVEPHRYISGRYVSDNFIYKLYPLNYMLQLEFNHYSRMLRREEANEARETRRVHRLLPSWIKSEERQGRVRQRWNGANNPPAAHRWENSGRR